MSHPVNLEFSKQEFDVVVEALSNMPWKTAHPVILIIDKQINQKPIDSEQENTTV